MITKNGARIFLTFLTKVDAQIEPYLTKYVSVERPTVKFEISFIKWPIILPNKRSFGPIGLLTDIKSTIASTQQSRNVIKGFLDHSNCLIIDSNEQKTTNGEQSFKSIYFYSLNLSKLALGLDHEMNNRSMNENAGVIKISTDYFFDEDIEVSKIPEGSLISSSVSNLLEYKRNGLLIHKEYFLSGKTGSFSYNCLNDLSRQVYLPASHYLFLSSECLDFVLKARPIDILFQILNIVNNETFIDEFEFNKFIACYGGIETCCMLLEIICNSDMHYYFNESLDKKLKTEYFIRIKQKQSKEKELFNQTTIQQQIKFIKASEENRVKAVNAFFKLGDSIPELKEDIPERRDFFEGYGRILQPEKKRYTYKIEGILLYFSRLIRPLWNKKIVNQSVFEHLIYDRLENFAEDELHLVRKRIMEIKNFMDSKNERLLIRQINTEDLNKAEKKAMFEFSKQQSFDNKYEFQESSNSNMLNLNKKNIEDVIWDEKVYSFSLILFFKLYKIHKNWMIF